MLSPKVEQFFLDSVSEEPSRTRQASSPQVIRPRISSQTQKVKKISKRAQKRLQYERSVQAVSSKCLTANIDCSTAASAEDLYRLARRSFPQWCHFGQADEALIGACIYLACAQAGPTTRRTHREVAELMQLPMGRVTSTVRKLMAKLELDKSSIWATPAFTREWEHFLPRYCDLLSLSACTVEVCTDIVVHARALGIMEAMPRSRPLFVVAGSIYFTCCLLGVEKSLEEVCEVFSDTTPHFRNSAKRAFMMLYAEKKSLVKSKWIEEGLANLDRLEK